MDLFKVAQHAVWYLEGRMVIKLPWYLSHRQHYSKNENGVHGHGAPKANSFPFDILSFIWFQNQTGAEYYTEEKSVVKCYLLLKLGVKKGTFSAFSIITNQLAKCQFKHIGTVRPLLYGPTSQTL